MCMCLYFVSVFINACFFCIHVSRLVLEGSILLELVLIGIETEGM